MNLVGRPVFGFKYGMRLFNISPFDVILREYIVRTVRAHDGPADNRQHRFRPAIRHIRLPGKTGNQSTAFPGPVQKRSA